MKFAYSQKGMSVLGWMTMLALVAFLASAVFKMVPHYLDYNALQKAIMSVETDKAANISSVPEFYSHISKSMTINSIRDLKLDEILTVVIEENEFRAHLKYETREPLIENLDLVARFDKEFRVRMP
jgi:hypothetical protein